MTLRLLARGGRIRRVCNNNLREKSGPKIKYPGEFGDPGGFGDLDKYPALVLHYSGGVAAAAFSPHTNR